MKVQCIIYAFRPTIVERKSITVMHDSVIIRMVNIIIDTKPSIYVIILLLILMYRLWVIAYLFFDFQNVKSKGWI